MEIVRSVLQVRALYYNLAYISSFASFSITNNRANDL